MSLIRKHGAVLQAWACLDLVKLSSNIVILLLLCTSTTVFCWTSWRQSVQFHEWVSYC